MVRNKQIIKSIRNRQIKKGLTRKEGNPSFPSLVFAKLGAIIILLVLLVSLYPKDINLGVSAPPHTSTLTQIPPKSTDTTVIAIQAVPSPVALHANLSTVVPPLKLPLPTPIPPDSLPDTRVKALHDYLVRFNSPLKDFASDFIQAADTYGIDWKLVPAISGVESTFGQYIPGGHQPGYTSYNGWGWGVYGDHVIRFSSWTEAIYTISKGLKENYINRGLVTPYQMNRVYAESPTWGSRVAYFLSDIDKFSQTYNISATYATNISLAAH